MKKILITIAIAAICFVNTADCGENDTQTLKAYTIQVGSHKKAEDAQREMDRLKKHGLEPFVDYEQVTDKGFWHRVYVGRFDSRKEAVTYAKELADKGVISGSWVKQKEFQLEIEKQASIPEEPPAQDAEPESPVEQDPIALDVLPPFAPQATEDTHDIQLQPDRSVSQETEMAEKETESAADFVEEESSPADVPAVHPAGKKENRFALGLKTSARLAPNASDFEISGSQTMEKWTFGNSYLFAGIAADLALTENWALASSIEKDLMAKLDIWELFLGAQYTFGQIHLFVPYVRGGIVFGQFEWRDAPGDFDNGIGLDGGAGLSFTKSNLQFGIETSYRYITYNYNSPSGNAYTANEGSIDLSGFVLSGTLSYLF